MTFYGALIQTFLMSHHETECAEVSYFGTEQLNEYINGSGILNRFTIRDCIQQGILKPTATWRNPAMQGKGKQGIAENSKCTNCFSENKVTQR